MRTPLSLGAPPRTATALLALMLACSPHSSAEDSTAARRASPQGDAPLPRSNVTVADRASWFGRLHWPNACEDDFTKTRLTDDGGLEFHPLSQGISLVVVRCALGAYQSTSVVLRLDERSTSPSATVLEFPTYESLDGATLNATRTAELAGEITVLDDRHALTVLSLARQIGDCGTWARYQMLDSIPRLEAFAERVRCPEEPGERAEPKPGDPPSGWKPVPLK